MLEIADGGNDINKLNIGLVMGDMTGYIHIQDQQQFYVEFDAYSVFRSSPHSNFIVNNGAQMWISADVRLIGRGKVTLDLDGHLAGVLNLTLEENRVVTIGVTATNSRWIGGEYVTLDGGILIVICIE
jgi:hypothetical protein